MEELARVKCVGREMEKAGMYQSLLAAESLCESDNAQDRQTGRRQAVSWSCMRVSGRSSLHTHA